MGDSYCEKANGCMAIFSKKMRLLRHPADIRIPCNDESYVTASEEKQSHINSYDFV
jgi:hypothetical protein